MTEPTTDGRPTFTSRVDWWLAICLFLIPCGAVLTISQGIVTADRELLWTGVVTAGVVCAVYGGLIFPMRYVIEEEALALRHGMVTQRVPLAKIERVAPSRNPLSAPALSLDRLRIDYGGRFGFALVSPVDRDGFLDALAETTGLTRDGDTLIRS